MNGGSYHHHPHPHPQSHPQSHSLPYPSSFQPLPSTSSTPSAPSALRPRLNSLCSAHGSSDNLYSSSFESASSFPDDPSSTSLPIQVQVHYNETGAGPAGERDEEVVIDENLGASDLCHLLALKLSLGHGVRGHLLLQLPELNLQRILEEDEEVLPQYLQYKEKGIHCKIVLKKEDPAKSYSFFEKPFESFHQDMVTFDPEEDLDTHDMRPTSRCLYNLQEYLHSSDGWAKKLYTSGPLHYHKQACISRQVLEGNSFAGQLSEESSFLCKDINSQEKDVVFNVNQYSIFIPIDEKRVERELNGASASFALFNESQTHCHWFSPIDSNQRKCWLTSLRLVKYGLINMRNNYHKTANISTTPTYSYSSMNGGGVGGGSFGRKNKSHLMSTNQFNCNHISKHEQPWFYGDMTRDEANACLSKYIGVDGVFLVRRSQRSVGLSVLSFIFGGKVNHVGIVRVDEEGGVYSLDSGKTKFYDLKQLIEFYQLNLPAGSLPTRLTHFLVHK